LQSDRVTRPVTENLHQNGPSLRSVHISVDENDNKTVHQREENNFVNETENGENIEITSLGYRFQYREQV